MRKYGKILLMLGAILGPLLVIYGIWSPVFRAFQIDQINLSDNTVMSSRDFPDKTTVTQTADANFANFLSKSILNDIDYIAEDLLQGRFNLENYPPRRLAMPFDEQAAFTGNSHWRLSYASFLLPEILLQAHIKTDQAKFLEATLNFMLGWDKMEQDTWSPESFIWNDHAVAARSESISKFWYYYKSHPSFDMEKGRKILNMAARYAAFLSRDLNYTFKTNHGTMQNIALLKLVLYFPQVKEIQDLKPIAVENLIEQFDFFINQDGVVLEHSAEYHAFGLNLISVTQSLFSIMDVDIPTDLTTKYQRGLSFLKSLRRPDGTLPKLGDTSEKFDAAGERLITKGQPLQTKNAPPSSLFQPEQNSSFKPASGYAVWWSGLDQWPTTEKLSQTAITWAYFPFMGHKHADELSYTLWKAGQEWWTNVGYWPYTDNRREKAISWSGANAPHLVGEAYKSKRSSIVLSHASNKDIKAIDLLRKRPDGFAARRQIVTIRDGVWITFDSFTDQQPRQGQVIWTLHPSLTSEAQNGDNNFRITGQNTDLSMDVFFDGSDGLTVTKVHGQKDPMAGWVGSEQSLFRADAFITKQDSTDGWISTISTISDKTAPRPAPKNIQVNWSSGEQWDLTVSYQGQLITVERSGDKVSLTYPEDSQLPTEITLNTVAPHLQSQQKVSEAYYRAEDRLGKRFMPLISYRDKVTKGLIALFFINGVFLFLFRRKITLATPVSLFSMGGIYYWLMNFYFVLGA